MIGAEKRRDPPKRVSHPTTEVAGGMWEWYRELAARSKPSSRND